YAGHYIPVIAFYINKYNHDYGAIKNVIHINIESILIGNGLVNPLVQFEYFSDIACDSSYGPVLNRSTCNQLRKDCKKCIKLTKTCYASKNIMDCITAEKYCYDKLFISFRISGKNIQDIRKPCNYSNAFCYPELQNIVKYSNLEDVKIELGVNSSLVYQIENFNIRTGFINSCDAAYDCNWLGIDAWTKALHWSGTKGFNDAKVYPWITSSGNYSGNIRTFKGFTFLKILNAGHLVPHDQPVSSLDFFNRWIFKKEL
ncbi:7069_t:CDS:2, partial [Dentiscutata heterogama]